MLVSTAISDLQKKLRVLSQRVSEADMLMHLNDANSYYFGQYFMPTRERETDLILFPRVYEYPLPTDFAMLINPHKGYNFTQRKFTHQSKRDFLLNSDTYKTAVQYNRDTPYLMVDIGLDNAANLDTEDDFVTALLLADGDYIELGDGSFLLAADGSINVTGDASDAYTDNLVFSEGNSSIKFTVTPSGGTTTITFSDMASVDLNDLIDQIFFFLDVYNPNDRDLTSVTFRIGNSASVYTTMTATTRFVGSTIGKGWGIIGFDPTERTDTGSVDLTALTWMQIVISHGTDSAAAGTYRIDNVFYSTGMQYQIPYYSLYNVKDTNGVYKEKVTATSDEILVPRGFDEAIMWKACEYAAFLSKEDSSKATYFARELSRVETSLSAKFPKQDSNVQTYRYSRRNRF